MATFIGGENKDVIHLCLESSGSISGSWVEIRGCAGLMLAGQLKAVSRLLQEAWGCRGILRLGWKRGQKQR